MTLTAKQLRAMPKLALHDHLDGGLRPATVLELADAIGHDLPADDEASLAEWFHGGASRSDLGLYLETFTHTVAVMQRVDHLERVAYEAGIDLADDGVVYAEVRYAPELNTMQGLTMDDVLEATTAGFERAEAERDITLHTIVTSMRTGHHAPAAAAVAARWADRGVVGFDLAGAEDGHPPAVHLQAIEHARQAGLGITLHAGEAYGLPSIKEAVRVCGADRIGHGVRLIDDVGDDDAPGPFAARVIADGIVLETCPSSNVHTGAVASMEDHPADRLLRLGAAVTINADNRLMSHTSTSQELAACVDTWGWGVEQMARVQHNAISRAFTGESVKSDLTTQVNAWTDQGSRSDSAPGRQ